MMKTAKQDRRVKYTITALKNALVERMQEERIAEISVTSICTAADVNRSTFYAHFSDQYDLLHYIEQEALSKISQYIEQQDFTPTQPISLQVLNRILEYVQKNAPLFLALLGERGTAGIQTEFMKLTEIFSFYGALEPRTKDYLSAFGVTGCISILHKWLQDGMIESTTEISEFILQVLYKGIISFQ